MHNHIELSIQVQTSINVDQYLAFSWRENLVAFCKPVNAAYAELYFKTQSKQWYGNYTYHYNRMKVQLSANREQEACFASQTKSKWALNGNQPAHHFAHAW